MLSSGQQILLQYLYDYKTLSLRQAWQAAFADKYSEAGQEWFHNEISPLMDAGLISLKANSFAGYRLELTGPGIGELCKIKGLPRFRYNEKGTRLPTLKFPSQLLIQDHLSAHQISLNQFLFDFRDIWASVMPHTNLTYTIEVEQLSEKYDYFRPDAEITISSPTKTTLHLYIEQDMGQESRKMMRLKWERYRRYIEARRGDQSFGSMIMLFIINYDTSMPAPHHLDFSNMPWCIDYRKRDVFLSMPYLYSEMLDGFFDTYTGTESEIINCVFTKLLPTFTGTYHNPVDSWLHTLSFLENATISQANSLAEMFGGVSFQRFSRILEDGHIKHNIAYVSDDPTFLPTSIFAKATHMQRVNQTLGGTITGAPKIIYLMHDPSGVIQDGLERLSKDIGITHDPQCLQLI